MEKLMFRVKAGRRAVFAALLFAALLCAACEQQPGETRETVELAEAPPKTPPADAIPIANEADLKKIGKAGYPLNRPYKLTADITVPGDWTPICPNIKFPFQGAFYGQGHTITITSGTGGLFYSIAGAAVYNLNVLVTAEAPGGSIGGIAGFASEVKISSAETADGVKKNLIRPSYLSDCTATVDLTLSGADISHNAAAGGIVGTMDKYVFVSGCTASGTITLGNEDPDDGLMVYAGGIAGYSGTPGQSGQGESFCVIEKSSWINKKDNDGTEILSTVSVTGGYPYAGGIVGYNYTGSVVRRCSAAGTVTATGGSLPYAGGVAGYNSGFVIGKDDKVSTIENCYSTAEVTAVSTSKAALAGGIAGANAKGAVISKCYATGAVTAKVAGTGTDEIGGSIGPQVAANAGGIAGAQYFFDKSPAIKNCAALNSSITGEDTSVTPPDPPSVPVWNIYRIAGEGAEGYTNNVWDNNIAWSGMSVPNHAENQYKTLDGKDGADCDQKPLQAVYAELDWDFSTVWKMESEYPVLK